MREWVIMNTKQKMKLADAIKWYNSADMTIVHATRMSERGACEDIYILGSGTGYGHKREHYKYVTDTGAGYGGKGTVLIRNVMTSDLSGRVMSTEDIMAINEKKSLPVWVFK